MSGPAPADDSNNWLRIGRLDVTAAAIDPSAYCEAIGKRLSDVLQVEHLALLLGSGLPQAVASLLGVEAASMSPVKFAMPFNENVEREALRAAEQSGRGVPNVEDQLTAALALAQGLRIMNHDAADEWEAAILQFLADFVSSVSDAESRLESGFATPPDGRSVLVLVERFLLAFASRVATKDRLHIFTTNYDRLIEYAADSAGLYVLDSFVGSVRPVFRTPRLSIDVHYNPPGLRGEPRYLEGVVRFTKLHGSIDWRSDGGEVVRVPSRLGDAGPLLAPAARNVLIYPNAAKDMAISAYPYSELFRDLAAAIVRPQSALVTYGYGFGDQHINQVLADMLRIPSTHLVIISYDDPGGRIRRFVDTSGSVDRIAVVAGPKLANFQTVVNDLLPLHGSGQAPIRLGPTSDAAAGQD